MRTTRAVCEVPLSERDPEPTDSIIRRALRELNIELILAHSPQAKGRVERNFGTSQDRLVKELRVRGISTYDEANQFLEQVYIPFWNERFALEPADPSDVHRRLSKRTDLERLFAETHTRTVANDFTIRYESRRLQIPKSQARGIRPGQKVTIELRLDGSVRYRWNERYLDLEAVARTCVKAAEATRSPENPTRARARSPLATGRPSHRRPLGHRTLSPPYDSCFAAVAFRSLGRGSLRSTLDPRKRRTLLLQSTTGLF